MPFKLQEFFFRMYQFIMKLGLYVLPVREPELYEGPGSSLALCQAIADSGKKKLLIVTDSMLVEIGVLDGIQTKLKELGVGFHIYDGVKPDPTVAQIEAGLDVLKSESCDGILAVGGGSPIDAAKVIATRMTNNKPIAKMAGMFRIWRSLFPLYAVPTTAGTGSEVSIIAVVSDPDAQKKFPIIAFQLVPQMAALDGELMRGLPPHITSATGMDALTHAVEAYISNNATSGTDELALKATKLIMDNLPEAVKNGGNVEARQNMSKASYLAGIAFNKAGVGYVHAISHNFGAYYHTPHGLGNAIVLPYVLDYSKPKCTRQLSELAEHCGMKQSNESAAELADTFIARIREMNVEFGIPQQLESLKKKDIAGITTAAMREAHTTYAVPKYMDRPTMEGFIAQMLVA